MKNFVFALLLLFTSCSSDEIDLFSFLDQTTSEKSQTREDDGESYGDSTGISIGLVMESAEMEEEIMEVTLGE